MAWRPLDGQHPRSPAGPKWQCYTAGDDRDIPVLVTGLQEAGRGVSLHVLGDPPVVPASVELLIYRPEAISIFVDDGPR